MYGVEVRVLLACMVSVLDCPGSSLGWGHHVVFLSKTPWGGEGVLPYMGYIGMCGPKGYGFSAVLVINKVSILADFGHFGHK